MRWFIFISLALASIAGAQAPPLLVNENVALGRPTKAGSDPNDYLLEHPQWVASYSDASATPNWVAWRVSKAWFGKADREDDFRMDDSLPASWFRCKPADYASTGFDRGHVCPSADRTKSSSDNSATFLMTNMMPQAPKLNRGTWKQLEDHCRKLALDGNELYVVAGPHGAGGHGKNGIKSRLAKRVTVPSACWKVFLVLPEDDDDDAPRVSKTTPCVGAVFPNSQSVESGWENYQVSVREVEELTGFDFFSLVDRKVQEIIESKGGDQ